MDDDFEFELQGLDQLFNDAMEGRIDTKVAWIKAVESFLGEKPSLEGEGLSRRAHAYLVKAYGEFRSITQKNAYRAFISVMVDWCLQLDVLLDDVRTGLTKDFGYSSKHVMEVLACRRPLSVEGLAFVATLLPGIEHTEEYLGAVESTRRVVAAHPVMPAGTGRTPGITTAEKVELFGEKEDIEMTQEPLIVEDTHFVDVSSVTRKQAPFKLGDKIQEPTKDRAYRGAVIKEPNLSENATEAVQSLLDAVDLSRYQLSLGTLLLLRTHDIKDKTDRQTILTAMREDGCTDSQILVFLHEFI